MAKRVADHSQIAGHLTITRIRADGSREVLGPFPNKVVSSSGHGRNLLLRRLAGDETYGIALTSAALGTNATAAADGDTNLNTPTETGLGITQSAVTNDELVVDVFCADGDIANATYREFGLFIGSQLFCRVVISDYAKASGEDTLFTYTLNATG